MGAVDWLVIVEQVIGLVEIVWVDWIEETVEIEMGLVRLRLKGTRVCQ